jgi:hypothetical protein
LISNARVSSSSNGGGHELSALATAAATSYQLRRWRPPRVTRSAPVTAATSDQLRRQRRPRVTRSGDGGSHKLSTPAAATSYQLRRRPRVINSGKTATTTVYKGNRHIFWYNLRLVFAKNRIRMEKKGNRAMPEERRGARMGAWTRAQASPVPFGIQVDYPYILAASLGHLQRASRSECVRTA